MVNHYQLTAADVQDLRGSVRWRLTTDQPPDCIRWDAADDHYYLYIGGHVQAKHQRVEVLAACLRAERGEPGWINRALDTRETCIEALLGAEERAAKRRQRDAQAATERAATEQKALATASPRSLQSADLDDFL